MNPFRRRKDKNPSARWKVTRTLRQGLKLPELPDGEGWQAGMEMQRDKDLLPTQPYSFFKADTSAQELPENHFNLETALSCFNPAVPQ